MSENEVKTRVSIEARMKGFEKAEKEAAALNKQLDPDRLTKGIKSLETLVGNTAKAVERLTKAVEKLNRETGKGGGGSGGGGGDGGGGDGSDGAGGSDDDSKRRKLTNRDRFIQGALQGAGLGEFIPGNEGARAMFAQVGGRMVGRGFRRGGTMGHGLAMSPFTGMAGLSQSVGAIPIVGGAAAAMLNQGASAAQMHLQRAQSREGLAFATQSDAAFDGSYRSMGHRFGMNETELNARMGMLLRSSGGTREGLGTRNLSAALGSQFYGADLMTSGAFLRAGRTGGLTGAQGRGGDALAETIGDALAAGLEGSEIAEYLQQTAAGIQQFRTTGMPMNARSVLALARTMSAGTGQAIGAFGPRAGQMASRLQGLGQSGPRSALDFMALSTMGGFSGGGTGDYIKSLARLQNMDFEQGGMDRLIDTVVSNGGGDEDLSSYLLSQGLSQLGMGTTIDDARLMVRERQGTLTPAEARKLKRNRGKMGRNRQVSDAADLAREGSGRVIGARSRQAGIADARTDQGAKFIGIVQDMEEATVRSLEAFGEFAPQIKEATEAIGGFAEKLPGATKAMVDFIDRWTAKGEESTASDALNTPFLGGFKGFAG